MASGVQLSIYALHRYFIWASRMRDHLLDFGPAPVQPESRRLWLLRTFSYCALWLSLLYVVAEGWEELELEDEGIATMLTSPNRELLRRFRNGAFHFQANYFDARFTEFLEGEEDPLAWATALHQAFGTWFVWWATGRVADSDRQ